MRKISVVIPLYNEEENIHELHRRLSAALNKDFADLEHEILFVDDGSRDNTFKLVQELKEKDPNVKAIQFSRNFGHHIAVTAGIDFATGDYVVMMDGDLQDQPEEIIKLYNKLQEGYEVVYGRRVNKQFSATKKMLSNLFNMFIKKLIDEDIVINSTIFRIMTKDVAENIRQLREQNRYIVGIIGWVGFNHVHQDVAHGERYAGQSKYNLSKQFKLAFDAIYSFSSYFLKLIVKLGLLLVLASLVMIVYVLYKTLIVKSTVQGWSSIMISVLLVGGLQIIVLGVIGEYIGRIYKEAKGRPLYVIKKSI